MRAAAVLLLQAQAEEAVQARRRSADAASLQIDNAKMRHGLGVSRPSATANSMA